MKNIVWAFILALFSNPIIASNNIICEGVPMKILSWKDGRVGVALEATGKNWLLCKKSQHDGCSAVLSSLLTAKSTKSIASLVIFNNTYSACDEIPDWKDISTDFDYVILK